MSGHRWPTRTAMCPHHGEYTSQMYNRSPDQWAGCPSCLQEQRAERDRQWNRDHADIPIKFQNINPSLPPTIHTWAASLIAGSSEGPLVIVGDIGTGKTHEACALLYWLIDRSKSGQYVTADDYGLAVRNSWSRTSEASESEVIRRYADAEILVLDELGAQPDIDSRILHKLICKRYDLGLMPSTIVVSNLATKNFADSIGKRAADRLREGMTLVVMKGESRRRPSRATS